MISRPPRPARLAYAAALASLSACAPMIHSPAQLPEPIPKVTSSVDAATEEASFELRARHDELALRIEHEAPPPPPAPAPPASPMDSKRVSIEMRNAKPGPLLWLLAKQFGLGLAVDPAVTAGTATINLYLRNVTGREALDHVLGAFDVSGTVTPAGVLQVKPLEERMFEIEELNNKSSLSVGAGGDLIGSGGAKQGSSPLHDTVSMSNETGDKGDGYDQLRKALEDMLGSPSKDAGTDNKPHYVMDSAHGALYVSARPSQIRAIARFVDEGKHFYQRQVRIDAQLIDVQLNDTYSMGIDWNLLGRNVLGRIGASAASLGDLTTLPGGQLLRSRTITIPGQQVGSTAGQGGGVALSNDVLSVALNALRQFGAVKVLSSPTLRVRNGSPAYLSVGTTYRYVQKITSNTSIGGSGASTSSVDVETDSVFSGVVIAVNAVVKADGQIELFVRPSQTDVDESSLALVDVGQGNKVSLPRVSTKSLNTTLNLRAGDTVLMGGLINQQQDNSNSGPPGLSDAPAVGSLFRVDNSNHSTRELVMVLRAQVI